MENEDLEKDLSLPEDEDAVTEENSGTSEVAAQGEAEHSPTVPDYEDIEREDIRALRREFPELSDISSLTELPNPVRYGALRDLGLTAREAYLATSVRAPVGKAHLRSHVPGGAAKGSLSMPITELYAARELFGDLSDTELQRLYKKVTR